MYDYYVFDLYGTLIDILTDESGEEFWRAAAELYSCAGAEYSPEELREKYLLYCREEEEKLALSNGCGYPEIRLENVFLRLLDGAAIPPEARNGWVRAFAKCFRTLSRKRLAVYPGTLPTLHELRRRGKRLFLLSNAQRVFTEDELALTGLDGVFDAVLISSDCGMKKPWPGFMRLLLERCGLDPARTVMVGNDVCSDMAVASECGVDGVLLNTAHEAPETIEKRIRDCGLAGRRITIIRSGDISRIIKKEG